MQARCSHTWSPCLILLSGLCIEALPLFSGCAAAAGVNFAPVRVVQADRFQRTGRTLRRKMWWQNCKMKIVVAFAVILLAVIIFLLVCFSGGNCLKSKK